MKDPGHRVPPSHEPKAPAGEPAERGDHGGLRKTAFRFVVAVGVASFFADLVHEGAHSTNGSFLEAFGASALAVAVISGLGEWLGYMVRLVSGYASDRSGHYWLWTLAGHLINVAAVPALALVGSWQAAAPLIVLERVGKGMRNPPRDAMLSFAGTITGQGRAFAIREAIDQSGAVLGPLLVALVLLLTRDSFRTAYAWLAVPGALCLATFLVARRLFPRPADFEPPAWRQPVAARRGVRSFPSSYWLYLGGMGLVAFGYADFNLVAWHLAIDGFDIVLIPVLYAVAMAMAGASAFVFGQLMDRRGLPILMIAVTIAAAFPPLLFLGHLGFGLIALGMALWGVGYGIQDSIMSAPVANMIRDPASRAWAFGVFNAGYGTAWLLGTIVIGVLLYTGSLLALVAVSMGAQLLALPVLALTGRRMRTDAAS